MRPFERMRQNLVSKLLLDYLLDPFLGQEFVNIMKLVESEVPNTHTSGDVQQAGRL